MTGRLLASAAALLYSLQNLAMRVGAASADPYAVVFFAGLPTVVLSVALVAGSPARRRGLAALATEASGRRLLLVLAVLGVMNYAVGNPLFTRSLALGGAVVATPSANTLVVWSVVLGLLILGERPGPLTLAGVGAFALGVALLAWGQASGQARGVALGPGWGWAIPLGVGAGFCWAASGVGTRYALARGVDAAVILAVAGGAGLSTVTMLVLGRGGLGIPSGEAAGVEEGRVLLAMVLAGIFNLGAQVASTLALRLETVATVSVISSSSVVIVAVLAWALLAEPLDLPTMVGVLAVFAGAVLVQRPGRASQPGPTKRKEESPLR